MTLDALSAEHHASLLAGCWRELNTLKAKRPKINGVYGVEDFSDPRNVHGMLEVECVVGAKTTTLQGKRMLPLVHGYHRHGPNSDAAGAGAPPSYHIAGATRSTGAGMPNLNLIRLAPPALDNRLAQLLMRQPLAVASVLATSGLVVLATTSLLGEPYRFGAACVLALLLAAHALEGVIALYVCAVELQLGAGASCNWAALVTLVGFPCTRWLLKLRPRKQKHANNLNKGEKSE